MGLYDRLFKKGNYDDHQVKCFENKYLRNYVVGDKLPMEESDLPNDVDILTSGDESVAIVRDGFLKDIVQIEYYDYTGEMLVDTFGNEIESDLVSFIDGQ